MSRDLPIDQGRAVGIDAPDEADRAADVLITLVADQLLDIEVFRLGRAEVGQLHVLDVIERNAIDLGIQLGQGAEQDRAIGLVQDAEGIDAVITEPHGALLDDTLDLGAELAAAPESVADQGAATDLRVAGKRTRRLMHALQPAFGQFALAVADHLAGLVDQRVQFGQHAGRQQLARLVAPGLQRHCQGERHDVGKVVETVSFEAPAMGLAALIGGEIEQPHAGHLFQVPLHGTETDVNAFLFQFYLKLAGGQLVRAVRDATRQGQLS